MALTTKQVAKLTEPGRYGDGGGSISGDADGCPLMAAAL